MMIRPDQEKFEKFSGLLTVFDAALERFCEESSFEISVDANRIPCRVLRKQRRSLELVGIYLDGDWKIMEYSENVPCSLIVCSYFESPPGEGYKLHKISETLASGNSAPLLASKIDVLLQRSLELFSGWSPEFIRSNGEEIRNLKRMYERGDFG